MKKQAPKTQASQRRQYGLWAAIGLFALLGYGCRPDFLRADKNPVPPPERSLQAPFSTDGTAPRAKAGDPLASLYTGGAVSEYAAKDGPLSTPHRQQDYIGDWLVRALSEVFNVDAANYARHLTLLATGMDTKALADYRAFMDSSGILRTMQAERVKLSSFVEQAPLLLNKGVVAGRYRWLFEMPVTLSFLPVNADYTKAAPVNQHVLVQVQVGRVEPGKGLEEMMIESFSVRKNPAYK